MASDHQRQQGRERKRGERWKLGHCYLAPFSSTTRHKAEKEKERAVDRRAGESGGHQECSEAVDKSREPLESASNVQDHKTTESGGDLDRVTQALLSHSHQRSARTHTPTQTHTLSTLA